MAALALVALASTQPGGCVGRTSKPLRATCHEVSPGGTGSGGDDQEGPTLTYPGGHPLNWLTDDPPTLAQEDEVHSLVNAHRAAIGRPVLVMDVVLRRTARGHSRHMRLDVHNFFAHPNPEGDSPGTRLSRNGVSWTLMAENIASGQADAAAAFRSWLDSPGHRRNLENGAYCRTGVGLQWGAPEGDYPTYWTQDFSN
jgi:uncharacterized protein YkwD